MKRIFTTRLSLNLRGNSETNIPGFLSVESWFADSRQHPFQNQSKRHANSHAAPDTVLVYAAILHRRALLSVSHTAQIQQHNPIITCWHYNF